MTSNVIAFKFKWKQQQHTIAQSSATKNRKLNVPWQTCGSQHIFRCTSFLNEKALKNHTHTNNHMYFCTKILCCYFLWFNACCWLFNQNKKILITIKRKQENGKKKFHTPINQLFHCFVAQIAYGHAMVHMVHTFCSAMFLCIYDCEYIKCFW